MLFELLTGAKPFHADDPMAVCMQHLTFAAPTLAENVPGRSFGALEAVVARALMKDPAQRFSSADEFSLSLVEAAQRVHEAPAKLPSPAATIPLDASALVSETNVPTVAAKRASRGKGVLAIAAVGVAAVATVIVVVATRSDAEPEPAPPPVVAAPAPVQPPPAPPSSADPVQDLVASALEMSAAGRREPAIDLLLRARKTYPKDARVPYQASKLYLEKMWWVDGLKQARAALALDPTYRSDADLIKLVLKGFNTTASYDWTLAKFLREDIGAPAKPFIEDTATAHPNPIVRKRAAAELKRYK